MSPRPFPNFSSLGPNLWLKLAVAIPVLLLFASFARAQGKQVSAQTSAASSQEAADVAHLFAKALALNAKFQGKVKLPAPRTESRLLPLLPESTVGFAAIANYGDVAHQAIQFLEEQLKEDDELRATWNRGEMATLGPKIEESLEKFSQLSQFLGDEIVFAAPMEVKDPNFLAVAEVRKPGLQKFLSDLIEQYGGEAKAGVHVMDPQKLATVLGTLKSGDLLVLVRPDFIIASEDLKLLRSFSAQLDKKSNAGLLSTPFGKRAAMEYQGGLTMLAAVDLQTILRKSPSSVKDDIGFKNSGFEDVKYFVWEHKELGAKTISESELSFNGPRHGFAAWLAKPGPLRSMDFVSPDTILAAAFTLTSPAQIFEQVKAMYPPGPANPFDSLPQAEKALGLSINDDLVGLLGGELVFELDSFTPPNPVWKTMVSVKDAAHLQKTISTLLALAQIKSEQADEAGTTYYTLQVPSTPKPYEIDYAFVDGFLVAGLATPP